jgi:DNA-binding MarR family transcriptional regulator
MRFEDVIKTTKFQNANGKAQLNLIHTASVIETYFTAWFGKFDLTMQQYNVLRIVRGQSPKSVKVKDISERVIYRNSNTTRIIDKLESKNLIERQDTAADKRAVHVVITQEGLDLMAQIDKVMISHDPHMKALEETEAEVLSMLLDKLRAHFDQVQVKPK